jgi:hypothetical protein
MPKVNNRPRVEHSPNLVTLVWCHGAFALWRFFREILERFFREIWARFRYGVDIIIRKKD